MNAFHTEEGSDHSDLSEDPLVGNLVACMIYRVVDETLGFSGVVESALEPQLALPPELPLAPPPSPRARTQESR